MRENLKKYHEKPRRDKSPATLSEQIRILKERGCRIEDEARARDTLKYINYYRLTNYFEPFEVSKHQYGSDVTFDGIMRVYELDRKLRSILLAALEEIEIALRAAISNYHAMKYGALGYLNPSSFGAQHNHQSFTARINHLIESSEDRDFVKHYIKKYNGKFPLWVMAELFSFGTLAFFYKDMHHTDKKAISGEYYSCSPSELDNWIFCLNELRNYCAHYNRLYASKFPIEPRTPRSLEGQLELKADVFGYMMIMKQLYHDKHNWSERVVKPVSRALKKNSDVIRLPDLGFTEGWERFI